MENRLYIIHQKVKDKLDAICQEAGDMDVHEFLQVYDDLVSTVVGAANNKATADRARTRIEDLETRNQELEELNKELEITEKARVKWKERCELKEGLLNIELAHSKTNSRRIKELEEERDNYKQQL